MEAYNKLINIKIEEEKSRPKISDKIRFWEEQDKINQALLPRILNMHELIKSSSLLAQKNSSDYLHVSSSLKDLKFQTDSKTSLLNQEIEEINNQIQNLKSENENFIKLLDKNMVNLIETIDIYQDKWEQRNNTIEKELEDAIIENKELHNQLEINLEEKNELIASNQSNIEELTNKLNKFIANGNKKINVFNIIVLIISIGALLVALFY
ncbi:MAG: hypothetical protein WCY77_09570 [Weeksellaceae bacterium]